MLLGFVGFAVLQVLAVGGKKPVSPGMPPTAVTVALRPHRQCLPHRSCRVLTDVIVTNGSPSILYVPRWAIYGHCEVAGPTLKVMTAAGRAVAFVGINEIPKDAMDGLLSNFHRQHAEFRHRPAGEHRRADLDPYCTSPQPNRSDPRETMLPLPPGGRIEVRDLDVTDAFAFPDDPKRLFFELTTAACLDGRPVSLRAPRAPLRDLLSASAPGPTGNVTIIACTPSS